MPKLEYNDRADIQRDLIEEGEDVFAKYGIELTEDESQNFSQYIWEFLLTLTRNFKNFSNEAN